MASSNASVLDAQICTLNLMQIVLLVSLAMLQLLVISDCPNHLADDEVCAGVDISLSLHYHSRFP